MSADEITIPMRNMKFVHLKVKTYFTREWKIRLWFFKSLIWLACQVMQCGITIEPMTKDEYLKGWEDDVHPWTL